jgi:hypothetical protein
VKTPIEFRKDSEGIAVIEGLKDRPSGARW